MKIKSIRKTGIEPTWDIEVKDVHEFILDNGCVSHNTSSLTFEFGSTEGINPVKSPIVTKSGTFQEKQIAPDITKFGMYYQPAFETDNKSLIKLAAIRQIFLDQGQSIDLFYKNEDNKIDASEIIEDTILAEKLKIKSLYYMNSEKAEEKEVCDSCGS